MPISSHRRNGNVKELKSMASEPKDQHCFILESFKEFEALARRALHQGKVDRIMHKVMP